MGREIKFRQFCSDEDHVDYGMHYMKFNGILVRDGDWHIMQYTGLKDKNGLDIYEGDIFKSEIHNPQNFHVEFVEGAWCATAPIVEGYPTEMNHFSLDSIEVIGNIYENPELLEV